MVKIELSQELENVEHSRSGIFSIPLSIKINRTKYDITSDLEDIENLPRGGFGLVIFYESKTKKKIAIKFININELRDKKGNSSVKKARIEVDLLEEMNQKLDTKCKKNIVNFIDSITLEVKDREYLLIILQKMDMDLSDYLEEISDRKIHLNTAKKIMRQITESLKCLHNMGIVYNDLKPDNVLVDRSRNSKLTDFNCILKLEEENKPEYEKKYTGCSTGSYRSPEQIYTAVSYDIKADSWQLGILFVCILQKSSRSFISTLSRKYQIERDDVIENLDKTIIEKQLRICKDKFTELNNSKEYKDMKELIFGLLNHNPEERWDIDQIINSEFLNTGKKSKSISKISKKTSKKTKKSSSKSFKDQSFSNNL